MVATRAGGNMVIMATGVAQVSFYIVHLHLCQSLAADECGGGNSVQFLLFIETAPLQYNTVPSNMIKTHSYQSVQLRKQRLPTL